MLAHWVLPKPDDLEVGDTAGLETCATGLPDSLNRTQLRKALRPGAGYGFMLVFKRKDWRFFLPEAGQLWQIA
jgi:hypothetical protein